jgi:hypothetical protein
LAVWKKAREVEEGRVKYSAADWLEKELGQGLPGIGIRAANVLGQTFKGIYHLEKAVLSKKAQWTDTNEVKVTIANQLATYDDPSLTRLVFCCRSAGLCLRIQGRGPGYLRLLFGWGATHLSHEVLFGRDGIHLPHEDATDERPESLEVFASRFAHIIKKKQQTENYIALLVDELNWYDIQRLVHECHKHSIRGDLHGMGTQSIELWLHWRQADGKSMYSRHPSLEEALKKSKDYTEIDWRHH